MFHPQLSWKTRLSGLACLLFVALGVWIMASDSENLILGLFVAITFSVFAILYFILPREIVFSDVITIKRRLLADKRIEYNDITSLGIDYLKARHGGLRWSAFENSGELWNLFDELMEAEMISEDQLDESASLNDLAWLYAGATWTIALTILLALLWLGLIPDPWMSGYPDWMIELVAPFAILGIVYLFFRFVWFGARMRPEQGKRS
ncbi:MAG: hypothetical protein AAF170_00175 [Bacteroidota bacterium]